MGATAESPQSQHWAGPASEDEPQYVGLATRAIAFAIDAAVIDLVAIVVAAAASLIVSLFHFPKELQTILKLIGAAIYVLWAFGYFVAFWSATGQTPGNRAMQIRVVAANGERVKPRRGIVRCVGLILAALPLFAGYALILFDRDRRGLQDRFAGTVVVEAPDPTFAQARRARMREAYESARGASRPGVA